jgi:hypothetical protein
VSVVPVHLVVLCGGLMLLLVGHGHGHGVDVLLMELRLMEPGWRPVVDCTTVFFY